VFVGRYRELYKDFFMPEIKIKMNARGEYEVSIGNDIIILSFEEMVLLTEKLNEEVNR